jgi:hypothetical protein
MGINNGPPTYATGHWSDVEVNFFLKCVSDFGSGGRGSRHWVQFQNAFVSRFVNPRRNTQ